MQVQIRVVPTAIFLNIEDGGSDLIGYPSYSRLLIHILEALSFDMKNFVMFQLNTSHEYAFDVFALLKQRTSSSPHLQTHTHTKAQSSPRD
jgi:hypothetical protein